MEERETVDEVFLRRLAARFDNIIKPSSISNINTIKDLTDTSTSNVDIRAFAEFNGTITERIILWISFIYSLPRSWFTHILTRQEKQEDDKWDAHEELAYHRDHELEQRRYEESLWAHINELRAALAEVRAELKRLSTEKSSDGMKLQFVAEEITVDCDHWRALLKTHRRVVRMLEMDQATAGIDLPIHKRIELEERNIRVEELKQQIAANCQ